MNIPSQTPASTPDAIQRRNQLFLRKTFLAVAKLLMEKNPGLSLRAALTEAEASWLDYKEKNGLQGIEDGTQGAAAAA